MSKKVPQQVQVPQHKRQIHSPSSEVAPNQQTGQQIIIGHISGVYGVRGWIKICSYTRPAENIFHYVPWHIEANTGDVMSITSASCHHRQQHNFTMETSFSSREEASKWKGSKIYVFRRQLPTLEDDSYYLADLIGLKVFNIQEEYLGQISQIYETAAHDVLVIKAKSTVFIPFIQDQFIKSVQLPAGRITVDWPVQWI